MVHNLWTIRYVENLVQGEHAEFIIRTISESDNQTENLPVIIFFWCAATTNNIEVVRSILPWAAWCQN